MLCEVLTLFSYHCLPYRNLDLGSLEFLPLLSVPFSISPLRERDCDISCMELCPVRLLIILAI